MRITGLVDSEVNRITRSPSSFRLSICHAWCILQLSPFKSANLYNFCLRLKNSMQTQKSMQPLLPPWKFACLQLSSFGPWYLASFLILQDLCTYIPPAWHDYLSHFSSLISSHHSYGEEKDHLSHAHVFWDLKLFLRSSQHTSCSLPVPSYHNVSLTWTSKHTHP